MHAKTDLLTSIEQGSSAETMAKLQRVLFPDAGLVIDLTWGAGRFWTPPPALEVVGMDILRARARHVVGDFTAAPFRDRVPDSLVVIDPPFLSDVGKQRPGIVGRRFGSYATIADVRAAVEAGVREAWRVCDLGLVVKCQTYIHASLLVDMPSWVQAALPVPVYARVEQLRAGKLRDPKWSEQLSPWSNSATFLAFRRGDQRHVRRRPPGRLAP